MNLIKPYMTKNMLHGLAFVGLYHMAKYFVSPFVCSVWTHMLQPRARNMISAYGSKTGKPWVLVTGGSDGIGEQMCHQFAKEGFNIVILSRTQAKMEKVAVDLKAHGVETLIIQYDFSKLNSVAEAENLISILDAKLEGHDVSILVNNVGFGKPQALHQ